MYLTSKAIYLCGVWSFWPTHDFWHSNIAAFRRVKAQLWAPRRTAAPRPGPKPKHHGIPSVYHHFPMESGVGKCPFLGICFTSPSNICWKLYPQYLGDVQLGQLPTPVEHCYDMGVNYGTLYSESYVALLDIPIYYPIYVYICLLLMWQPCFCVLSGIMKHRPLQCLLFHRTLDVAVRFHASNSPAVSPDEVKQRMAPRRKW